MSKSESWPAVGSIKPQYQFFEEVEDYEGDRGVICAISWNEGWSYQLWYEDLLTVGKWFPEESISRVTVEG